MLEPIPEIETHVMDLLYLILTGGAILFIGLIVFLVYTKKFQAERSIICRDCYKLMSRDKSGNWVCKCGRVWK